MDINIVLWLIVILLSIFIILISVIIDQKKFDEIMKESKRFNNLQNFIDMQREMFESNENNYSLLISLLLLIIITENIIEDLKLFGGFGIFIYICAGIMFIIMILWKIGSGKIRKAVMKRLYEMKDSKDL